MVRLPGIGKTTSPPPNPAGAITPNRRTHVLFDTDESVPIETPWAIQRPASEINRDAASDYFLQVLSALGADASVLHSHLLTGSAWAIEPIQENQSNLSETNVSSSLIIGVTDMLIAATMATVNRFRDPSSDLPGITSGVGVQSTGDPFLVKKVPASGSFADTTLDSDVSAFPMPIPPSANIPMDRVVVGTSTYPSNQGYYLRMETSGIKVNSPDNLLTFYFGGPASSDGSGQYCILFTGYGFVTLYEALQPSGGTITWKQRDKWKVAEPNRIADGTLMLRIWPYVSPYGGGYIEFRSYVGAESLAERLSNFLFSNASSPTTHLYKVDKQDARTDVTGPGVIRVDIREDLRLQFQVSLLGFYESAKLVDDVFHVPFAPGQLAQDTPNSLDLSWTAVTPQGASTVIGKLHDATTHLELSLVSRGDNFATYQLNVGQSDYYAAFDLTGDGTKTPTLWQLQVKRDGALRSHSGVNQEGGVLRSVSITGQEYDPSHSSASCLISDLINVLPFLHGRASMPCRIETEYDTSGTRSVLFQGYLTRADAKRRGVLGVRYPSPKWHDYECTFMGQWQRLQEQYVGQRYNFGLDPNAGANVPYKVTDVIRQILQNCGYLPSQIDVPDASMRLWPPAKNNNDELSVDPFSNIAEFVYKLAHDYLGWFIVHEPNSNKSLGGTWRVVPPNVPPYVNLARFMTNPPGGGKLSTAAGTYSGQSIPAAFIRRHTLQTFVKPPEANAVFVTGTGKLTPNAKGQYELGQWAVNFNSLNNLNSPDYLGRLVPLFISDPTLTTQESVDWVARRYYDFTCHALTMAIFEAPLLLVNNNDADTRRPLRYYDPIQIIDSDGTPIQYLIRNCNPTFRKDHIQMARYECQLPVGDGTTAPPSIPIQ